MWRAKKVGVANLSEGARSTSYSLAPGRGSHRMNGFRRIDDTAGPRGSARVWSPAIRFGQVLTNWAASLGSPRVPALSIATTRHQYVPSGRSTSGTSDA